MKILNIFNHYLESGGEAHAVHAISGSLSHILDLETCDFASADWVGQDAPASWKQAAWMLRNPRSLTRIREHHRRFKPDAWLVHNVFPVGSAAIYSEARSIGVPVIQYLHNFRPFSVNGHLWADNRIVPGGLSGNYWEEIRHGGWQNSQIKTAWLAFVLSLSRALGWWRSVRAWVAVSDFMRQKFISAGLPTADVFTLRHFWKPTVESFSGDGAHYLYLGRLIEPKGVGVLLDAWGILERELGSASPRLVIGGTGPLRGLVISRAERMQSVTFVGELAGDAKRKALDDTRALIVPSIWWEPLGLVVYEAYDFSRPVLAARSGGLPEIVIDGETGLLHEPGNSEQLASHVMELERHRQARHLMGREGRIWLEQNADEGRWQCSFREIATQALNRSD